MRPHFVFLLILTVGLFLAIDTLKAGGPSIINKNGEPVTWDATKPVPFTPDQGPLGLLSNEEAVQLVIELFQVWQDISSASVTFKQDGQLSEDIDSSNVLEFLNNLTPDTSPIIFDDDGSITDAILGVGASEDIIGFAGSEFLRTVNGVVDAIVSGSAVMNGKFFDGLPFPEKVLEDFRGTFAHEFGHYIGLDHSQINLEQKTLSDPANVPLMFPEAIDGAGETLQVDDITAVSALYPTPSFETTTGTIKGRVFLSDGVTQFQGANVIARNIDNPKALAFSSVSGFLHSGTFPESGSDDPQLLGFYEINGLGPGDYIISIEQIDPTFSFGSSVGSLEDPVPLPGIPEFFNIGESNSDFEECAGVISVDAGQMVEDINITINNPSNVGSVVSEQEPNNSLLDSQTITTLTTISGDINQEEKGDLSVDDDFEDIFSFTLDTTRFVSTFLSFQGENSNLDLVLFDESLKILGLSRRLGAATESLGPIELIPGAYFIGVSSVDGILNLPTGYTLNVVGSCIGNIVPSSTPSPSPAPVPTPTPTQTPTPMASPTLPPIPVDQLPVADFSADPILGIAPLTVQFTDLSTGNPASFVWEFGDGSTSTERNPSHTYRNPGLFTVRLTVATPIGTDSIEKENLIEVFPGETPVTPTPTPTAIPTPTPTITSVPTPAPKANIEVRFDPNPVPESPRGEWNFRAFVEETNGIGVTINNFEINDLNGITLLDGNTESFVQLFNSCGSQPDGFIPGFDTSCADLTRTGSPGADTFIFSGIDENGNNIEASGTVVLESTTGGRLPRKQFTVSCEHSFRTGPYGLERLILNLGEDESCTLKFTNLYSGTRVKVLTKMRKGLKSSVDVTPIRGVIDANGELAFTIKTIDRGLDWIAWAVPDKDGKFRFNKASYDGGSAWGMFVEVK